MKVEDFYNKPRVSGPPNKARVISFVNETREQEYEEQLATLQEEIVRLTEVERQFIDSNAKFQNTEVRLDETLIAETELQTKINVLENEMSRLGVVQEEKQEVDARHKDLRGQFDSQVNEINTYKKQQEENDYHLHQLTSQVNGLQSENSSITAELEVKTQMILDTKHEFEDYKTVTTPELTELSAIRVQLIEEKNKSSLLSQELSRVEGIANRLTTEKRELEATRTSLQAWAEAIESDNTTAQGINSVNRTELQKVKAALTTLTKQVDDLVGENKMLASHNAEMIEELARPKHMSVGGVERLEGFKLPANATFGGHHLGTGVPTLLKIQQEDKL
tara:strand:+ start:659 stop:1663 length:1005 start_codon:yes stop_codon:yes gene_type:complete